MWLYALHQNNGNNYILRQGPKWSEPHAPEKYMCKY